MQRKHRSQLSDHCRLTGRQPLRQRRRNLVGDLIEHRARGAVPKFRIGWVVNSTNFKQIYEELLNYIASPEQVAAMQRRCFEVYRQSFSRESQIDKFDSALRRVLPNQ